ncbi:ANKRD50 [Symbiodinium natans]|uniref:ANKRD50 protein n=1 Tax=Symbiodinium natans TaxID=878477 RepID=A0A812MWY5_9DINO|nr:ANKRD50 [Symbiodinium natans]
MHLNNLNEHLDGIEDGIWLSSSGVASIALEEPCCQVAIKCMDRQPRAVLHRILSMDEDLSNSTMMEISTRLLRTQEFGGVGGGGSPDDFYANAADDEETENQEGEKTASDLGASGDDEVYEAYASYKESGKKLKDIQKSRAQDSTGFGSAALAQSLCAPESMQTSCLCPVRIGADAKARSFLGPVVAPMCMSNTLSPWSCEYTRRALQCSGRMKQFMVHYALPLFQETEEERYLLEWRLSGDAVEMHSSRGRRGSGKKVSCWKRSRARLLRFGGFFQRRIVRQALDEFAMLWLEIFDQSMLPKSSIEVLCALTAANVRVPFKMQKKDIPQRWEEEVRRLLEDGAEVTHSFSPDALMSATQRLGSLPADAAVGLVDAVCQVLREVERKAPLEVEKDVSRATFESAFGSPDAPEVMAGGSQSTSAVSAKDLHAADGDSDVAMDVEALGLFTSSG